METDRRGLEGFAVFLDLLVTWMIVSFGLFALWCIAVSVSGRSAAKARYVEEETRRHLPRPRRATPRQDPLRRRSRPRAGSHLPL